MEQVEVNEQVTSLELAQDKAVESNGFTTLPQSFEKAKEYCEYLSTSGVVPKNYIGKPQDIFVAISWGQQVGIRNPIAALKNIAVINGTPSLWGDMPLALVQQSPVCEFIMEDNEAFVYARDNVKGWEHLAEKDMNSTSICVGKRTGRPVAVREFSVDDVEKAKLGNVHKSYPKDMRKYKARARLINFLFPDVIEGMAQAELVMEGQENDDTAPDLNTSDNPMNQSLKNALGDIEGQRSKGEAQSEDNDVEEAQVVEEERQEAKDDQEPKKEQEDVSDELDPNAWSNTKKVAEIVRSSKYLSGDESKRLNETISGNNGKLTNADVEYWQEQIRKAHAEIKAMKEKK